MCLHVAVFICAGDHRGCARLAITGPLSDTDMVYNSVCRGRIGAPNRHRSRVLEGKLLDNGQ